MLTTSLSQDLYKLFVNPSASDRNILFVARCTTVVAASLAVGLAIALGSVVDALTIFYTLLSVSLFVPILAGLYVSRASTPEAMTSIVCGVITVLAIQFGVSSSGIAGLTPALMGLIAAATGFGVGYAARMARYGARTV